MTAATLHVYPGQEGPARLLAEKLGVAMHRITIHTFPDGESLLRVQPVAGTVLLYASLDHPNDKLIHILQAAQALRHGGASRVVLVCPYLCYMRQDMAFHEGEAVTQKLLGPLLGPSFDRIVTVDPHLHRVSSLTDVFPGHEADALSAAALIGEAVAEDAALNGAVLVGPDGESQQWVARAALASGLDFIIATKERFGDRDVRVSLPDATLAAGRPAVIIDDLISSGATMQACARLLLGAGATHVEAMAVHAVCSAADLLRLREVGISRVRSCDSIIHETNAIALAPLLAGALTRETRA